LRYPDGNPLWDGHTSQTQQRVSESSIKDPLKHKHDVVTRLYDVKCGRILVVKKKSWFRSPMLASKTDRGFWHRPPRRKGLERGATATGLVVKRQK